MGGLPASFITRLPANDIGNACLAFLRQYGVDTKFVLRGGDRLGIYYLEAGAAQRASKVIYDRAGSAFATLQTGMLDWKTILADASWFHWTGITPAVSEGAAAVCLEAIRAARQLGLTVSCDLNYRAKLWKWGRPAGEVMAGDLPFLFERFYRGEKSRSREHGGAGIGLSIVKELVEAHGGVVAASLAEGLLRISVTLPATWNENKADLP